MDWSLLIAEVIADVVLPIVKDIIIILVVAVAGLAVKWWKDLTLDDWIKELIIEAVMFVQEKYWEASGEEKFRYAKEWVIERLNEKGITVDHAWLEALIDATVARLRDEFNDWYYQEHKRSK